MFGLGAGHWAKEQTRPPGKVTRKGKTQTLNNGIDLNLINKSQYVINSHFIGKKTGPIGFKVFCPNTYNESMKLNKQNQNCMGQS